MLRPRLLRHLDVDPATHPRGQPHLSSASGLVPSGGHLYLVADDEHHLGELAIDSTAPVRLLRVLPHDLAEPKEERKRHKPDFETLTVLPPGAMWPHGALLALGSGSRPQRCRAVLLPLDAAGRISGPARAIDLSALYAPLQVRFGDLNIEGGFACAGSFHLLQRANSGCPVNACITWPLAQVLAWIAEGGATPPAVITTFELGTVDGVPYGFTDASALPAGGWVFSAVAEDTADSYADGRCAGSALGAVGADGALQWMQPLADAQKVEGVAVLPDGRLLLVTDADDPALPSALLEIAAPPSSRG